MLTRLGLRSPRRQGKRWGEFQRLPCLGLVLDLYGFRPIGPRYARDAPVQSDAQQQSHHEHNEDKQKLPRPASGIFKPKLSNLAYGIGFGRGVFSALTYWNAFRDTVISVWPVGQDSMQHSRPAAPG